MRVIRVIAANTLREALRDKILYLFFGFAGGFCFRKKQIALSVLITKPVKALGQS